MKKTYVKTLALLLSFLFFCQWIFFVPTVKGEEGKNHIAFENLYYFTDLCFVGETLYLLAPGQLYRVNTNQGTSEVVWEEKGVEEYYYMSEAPQEEAQKLLWEKAFVKLVAQGENLYGYHPYKGSLSLFTEKGWEEKFVLPQEMLCTTIDGEPQYRGFSGAAIVGETFYLLLEKSEEGHWGEEELFAYDLPSGSYAPLPLEGENFFIAPGDEGELMVLNNHGEYKGVKEKGKVTPWFTLPPEEKQPSVFTYWQGQTLQLQKGKIIGHNQQGEEKLLGYMPTEYTGKNTIALSSQGIYAYLSGNQLFLRDITLPPKETLLTLAGVVPSNVIQAFALKRPDIALTYIKENAYGEKGLETLLLSGEAIDLCVLSSPGSFNQLMEKDFFIPIEDPLLKEKVQKMYPGVVQALTGKNGEVMGYPLNIMLNTWTLNETPWEEVNLGKVPSTYRELFTLLETWKEKYEEDYPQYIVIQYWGGVKGYLKEMTREYLLQGEEEYPDFTQEKFKKEVLFLLEKQELINSFEENFDAMPLIYNYYQGFGINYNDSNRTKMMLMPGFDEGTGQKIQGKIEVMAIPQRAQNKEAALALMAFMAQEMNEDFIYSLFPDENTPLRPKDYDKKVAEKQETIVELEKQLLAAKEDEKEPLRQAIEKEKETLARWEKDDWLISLESIENYRSIAEKLVIPVNNPLLETYEGMDALDQVIEEGVSKGLTKENLDDLLTRMNEVAKMVMMEGE